MLSIAQLAPSLLLPYWIFHYIWYKRGPKREVLFTLPRCKASEPCSWQVLPTERAGYFPPEQRFPLEQPGRWGKDRTVLASGTLSSQCPHYPYINPCQAGATHTMPSRWPLSHSPLVRNPMKPWIKWDCIHTCTDPFTCPEVKRSWVCWAEQQNPSQATSGCSETPELIWHQYNPPQRAKAANALVLFSVS